MIPRDLTEKSSCEQRFSHVTGNGNETADDSNNELVIITIFHNEHKRIGINVKKRIDQKIKTIL